MGQTATILLTDLVESTPTRVRLGEARADDLRRGHDALLAEQAAAFGGTVVKGLGDGLLIAFAGAAEALEAAVAMQQALHVFWRREGVALAMRIGLSVGDVTFEDGDCFGMPVIEASRLCAVAEPGQVLAAQLVTALARDRTAVDVVACGSRELKGLPSPVDVCEVRWEPSAPSVGLGGAPPYVGRVREQEVLRDRWLAATRGSGGLVLIAGEPGIGKTRLVEQVSEVIVRAEGGEVLAGACHDGDVVANAPFVEALSEWVRSRPTDIVADVFAGEASVVARVVPAIQHVLGDVGEPLPVPPEAETARLHDAVGQVLLRLAQSTPVLLVVDDLHWADDATVGMLRAVSRAARRGALLIVGTYRETDIDRQHPFAQASAGLQREAEPTRVVLDGLAASEVHALLEKMAEHDVPEDLATLLASETEGNPFFLRETLLHLWEEGQLRFNDGVWSLAGSVADLGIPVGIRDVIGRRLSRLPDATNRLLAVGSLFEVAFPLLVAADVAALSEDDALDAIDAALEARILRATDRFDEYAFTHALFRHTLVEELNPSRQVRTHRAIAAALERQLHGRPTPVQAAALARHYQRSAALPNAEQGVPYAITVADDAVRRYARREEYDALSIALELLPDGDERELALLQRRAEAAVFGNVGSERVLESVARAGELVRLIDGDDAACDYVMGLAVEAGTLEDLRLSWDIATVARQWLRPERRDATYLWLRSYELAERDFDDPEHPGLPLDTPERRELRELGQSLPLSEVRLSSTNWFSPSGMLWVASRPEAERLRDAALATNNPFVWYAYWMLGAHREVRDVLHARVAEARTSGVLPPAVFGLALLTRIHAILGEWDDSEACFAEAFALAPRIAETSNPVLQLAAAMAACAILRGELVPSTALSTMETYRDAPDARWAWSAITAFRGWLCAEEGNTEDAQAVLHELVSDVQRAGGWAPNYPILVTFLVRTLWALQRTDYVDILERNLRTKILEPDVRYPETDSCWQLAQLCALDGRVDEARHWFNQARRVLTEQGSETLLIWLDYNEAEMNVRLGTLDDLLQARALLDRARSRCKHPALAPWVRRIENLATRCRT